MMVVAVELTIHHSFELHGIFHIIIGPPRRLFVLHRCHMLEYGLMPYHHYFAIFFQTALVYVSD